MVFTISDASLVTGSPLGPLASLPSSKMSLASADTLGGCFSGYEAQYVRSRFAYECLPEHTTRRAIPSLSHANWKSVGLFPFRLLHSHPPGAAFSVLPSTGVPAPHFWRAGPPVIFPCPCPLASLAVLVLAAVVAAAALAAPPIRLLAVLAPASSTCRPLFSGTSTLVHLTAHRTSSWQRDTTALLRPHSTCRYAHTGTSLPQGQTGPLA